MADAEAGIDVGTPTAGSEPPPLQSATLSGDPPGAGPDVIPIADGGEVVVPETPADAGAPEVSDDTGPATLDLADFTPVLSQTPADAEFQREFDFLLATNPRGAYVMMEQTMDQHMADFVNLHAGVDERGMTPAERVESLAGLNHILMDMKFIADRIGRINDGTAWVKAQKAFPGMGYLRKFIARKFAPLRESLNRALGFGQRARHWQPEAAEMLRLGRIDPTNPAMLQYHSEMERLAAENPTRSMYDPFRPSGTVEEELATVARVRQEAIAMNVLMDGGDVLGWVPRTDQVVNMIKEINLTELMTEPTKIAWQAFLKTKVGSTLAATAAGKGLGELGKRIGKWGGAELQALLAGVTFITTSVTDPTGAGYAEWGLDTATLGLYGIGKLIATRIVTGDDSTPAGKLRKADFEHKNRMYASYDEEMTDTVAPYIAPIDLYDDPTMAAVVEGYMSTDKGQDHVRSTLLRDANNLLADPGVKMRGVTLDNMVDKFAEYIKDKSWSTPQDLVKLSRQFYMPSYLQDDPTAGGRLTDNFVSGMKEDFQAPGNEHLPDALKEYARQYNKYGRATYQAELAKRMEASAFDRAKLYEKGKDWYVGGADATHDKFVTTYLLGNMIPQLFQQHSVAGLTNGFLSQYNAVVLGHTDYRPIPNMTVKDFMSKTPWYASAGRGLEADIPSAPEGTMLPSFDPNVNTAIHDLVVHLPAYRTQTTPTNWAVFYKNHMQQVLVMMNQQLRDKMQQQTARHITDRLPHAPMHTAPSSRPSSSGPMGPVSPAAALLPTSAGGGTGDRRTALDTAMGMNATDLHLCATFADLAYHEYVGTELHPGWMEMIQQGWSVPEVLTSGSVGAQKAVLTYNGTIGQGILVLAFRGTVGGMKGVGNWAKNLNATHRTVHYSPSGVTPDGIVEVSTAPDHAPVMMHEGFWQAWQTIAGKVEQAFDRMFKGPGRRQYRPRVLVTGHSLGSAMAACSLLCLPPEANPHYYGFGTPRVGDRRFGDIATKVTQGRFFRCANLGDPVAVVPAKAFGYRHAGVGLRFSPDGSYRVDTDDSWSLLDARPKVSQHDMKLYKSNAQIVERKTPKDLMPPETQPFATWYFRKRHCQSFGPKTAVGRIARFFRTYRRVADLVGGKRPFSS